MKTKFLILIFWGVLIAFNLHSQDSLKNKSYKIFYYPNNKKSSEGYMRNGRPDGYWKTYYITGLLKAEGNRKNYLLDSTWIFYTSYGDTLTKVNYLYGKKNGYSIKYNTDRDDKTEYIGNIIEKELYVNDKKEGKSYYYYNNGKIKKISEFLNNKLHNKTYEFDMDGRIVTILTYNKGILTDQEKINRFNENNKKEGIWKEFYDDFKVKKEIDYSNDLIDGLYKEYDKKGDINLLLRYDNGMLVDENEIEEDSIDFRNEYDDSGNLIYNGAFKDNIPFGIHRYYNKDGKVINSIIYNNKGVKLSEGIVNKEGSKEGDWNFFYKDGKLRAKGHYSNNFETGPWKYYFKDGKEEQEGEYERGKYKGLWTWYFEDGTVKKEENYYNGKEEGLFVEYNENGDIIKKGEYFDGEKEGEWFYFVNDHKEVGSYTNGLKDGKWKYYYDNDNLQFEGSYIQGNPDGKHKYYYDDGTLKEEQYYVQGMKQKHWKKFNENGELIIVISYKDNNEVRINGQKIEIKD